MTNLMKYFCGLFGGPQKRYESKHAIMSAIAQRNGFRLYNKNLTWLSDEEFLKVWSLFPHGGRNIHERKFNFFNIAKSIRNIPGDLAECGVFHGGSSHLMLAATSETDKHLHGFDSFEGLSDPSEVDLPLKDYTFKWKKHDMRFDIEKTHTNLSQHQARYTLYKGWIPERFFEVANRKFSLVHIDVDLYEPTKAALEFFYPRLSIGGVIICDDYGSEACPGAKKAMDSFFSDKPESSVVHLTTGQGLVVRQMK
jgi:O-methyltransferase